MPGVPKWVKEKQKRLLPDYNASEEETKWYHYCVRNNIRISPIGIDGIGKWYIGISDPSDYKKVYNSRFIYDRDTIWPEFYKMCKYYYEKQI